MNNRDCPHGHQRGKCDTTHLYELRRFCAVHAAEVLRAPTWRERRAVITQLQQEERK